MYDDVVMTIIISLSSTGIPVHDKGTAVTIEGPRFSSRAESHMLRQFGGDLVNMTTVPEVVLAKEAGICYAAIAMATDYDCWRTDGEHVNVADVLAMFRANVDKVTQILTRSVENIAKEEWTETIGALQEVVNSSVMLPHN